MTKQDNILIIGGDTRQKYLYYELLNNGYHVSAYDVPDIKNCSNLNEALLKNNIFILPIPFSKSGKTIYSPSKDIPLDFLLSVIKPFSTIYGGCISAEFKNKCQNNNIAIRDFMDDNSFELKNAIATAEGAIAQAIIESPINLHLSNCLVLGYGKCGRAIANRLHALNCNVCVCVRRHEQMTLAFEAGHRYMNITSLAKEIGHYDYIFNTIPALVLTRNVLCNAKSEVTIIDIASNPGGTDFDACSHLGLNAHLCLSIPGKYAPKTSSKIIYDCL